MENFEEKLASMFRERITDWEKSQIGQKSGYEYERSFVEMMREIEEEVFKELTSTEFTITSKQIERICHYQEEQRKVERDETWPIFKATDNIESLQDSFCFELPDKCSTAL